MIQYTPSEHKLWLKKSRLWRARDDYNTAYNNWLNAHELAWWTINNRAKRPEYNQQYQDAKYAKMYAENNLKSEESRAKDFYKKNKKKRALTGSLNLDSLPY